MLIVINQYNNNRLKQAYDIVIKQQMGQQSSSSYLQKASQSCQLIHHPQMATQCQNVVLVLPNGNKVIQYSLAVSSREATKQWQQQLKDYFANIDTSLLYLPIKYHYKANNICGSVGIMQVFYQYFPTTLYREVLKRVEVGRKIDEEQIWKIMYTICSVANQLHQKDKKLGLFGLQTIFINKQNSEIKVGTGLSFYSDMIIDEILSPQSNPMNTPTSASHTPYSIKLEQSFCIGVLLLCSMLLIPKPPILSAITNGYPALVPLFHELKVDKNYSKQLKEIILRMCHINPALRITPEIVVKGIEKQTNIQSLSKPSRFGGNKMIKIDTIDSAAAILRQSDQTWQNYADRARVTLGKQQFLPSERQLNEENSISTYSNRLKKTIQKTESQYLPSDYKKQHKQMGQWGVQSPSTGNDQYQDFLHMVDAQLENSRNSFPARTKFAK